MDTNKTDKHWDILQSEYLHRRPWLTVRRDTVRLPDGTVNPEFYILEYPEWVNVIALTADGLFVLVRQYRHGIRKTLLELVAGVVDRVRSGGGIGVRGDLQGKTVGDGGHAVEGVTVTKGGDQDIGGGSGGHLTQTPPQASSAGTCGLCRRWTGRRLRGWRRRR